jgi:sterol desaturase/sphingolipid hydroxylase (fatty acid hydroxylase superfamily)
VIAERSAGNCLQGKPIVCRDTGGSKRFTGARYGSAMPDAFAVSTALLRPLGPLFVLGSQYYWPTYLGAAGVAAALYAARRKRGFRPRALIRHLLPARIVRHPSSWLDFKLFLIALGYLALQAPVQIAAALLTFRGVQSGFDLLLGPGETAGTPSLAVTAGTIVLTFLAIELGYWTAHFAMHRIPALWEFHKVHHSAEVLTPLTEWRQHPLELMLFPVVIGATTAAVRVPMLHAFGPRAQLIDPSSLIVTAFAFTILHLRHSELPFAATGWLGRLIQSPGHHQIHHSARPEHHDRNLGFCLSLWDWVFGTLCLPERGARYVYGLGEDDPALRTATGSMLAPFGRAAGRAVTPSSLGPSRAPAPWRTPG